MQLIFPTQTYSFLQRKTSMHNPQNMEKILHQCKISMHSPQNVDKILHQHKISTYSPENMDEILLQCKTSTQRPQNVEEMHLQRKISTQRPQNVEEIPLHQHKKKGSLIGLPSLFICREEISCSLPEDPQLRSLSPPKSLRS